MLPWSFKILYGLTTDNVPIFGSRRKSWIIIMGAIQFLTLMSLFVFEPDDPLVVALVLSLTSFAEAFTNVISQAMMVVQARRDAQFGQQDFVTVMYVFTALGGATGCVFGGLMTQYYHPKWCFFWYSFFGLLIIVFALFLTKDSEEDITEQYIQLDSDDVSTSEEEYQSEFRRGVRQTQSGNIQDNEIQVPARQGLCFNFRKNCVGIGKALVMREIYFLVIFIVAYAILSPSFADFTYYFLLDVI